MADRIVVIEELCEHGTMIAHLIDGTEHRVFNAGGWFDEVKDECPGGSRRVLDPGSYVRYMGEWNGCLPIYDQLPVVTRAALAHLHGQHDEPTAYCPLCGFFEDESALDALAGGEQP